MIDIKLTDKETQQNYVCEHIYKQENILVTFHNGKGYNFMILFDNRSERKTRVLQIWNFKATLIQVKVLKIFERV